MAVDKNQSKNFCRRCCKPQRKGRTGAAAGSCDCALPVLAGSQDNLLEQRTSNPLSLVVNRPDAALPELGERFEILEFIGEGGMGAVYKVREKGSEKIFAAKVLKEDLASEPAFVKRFEQEVRAASALTHPNLIFIHGAYRAKNGAPYMVMNYVDGMSLAEAVETQGPMMLPRALHARTSDTARTDVCPAAVILASASGAQRHDCSYSGKISL